MNSNIKALIIGYGSIGKRHREILSGMGIEVSVLTRRGGSEQCFYSGYEDAFADNKFDYVVVSTETSNHGDALKELERVNFSGTVLVEKPLFTNKTEAGVKNTLDIYVAYNMRFSPLVKKLTELIRGEELISVVAYVGQYLPDWRPDSDYRNSYSARKSKGGGVLRDLSHELDLLLWLLGPVTSHTTTGGKLSDLEIDCEDTVMSLLEFEKCKNVSLTMNYLDRKVSRFIIVNTSTTTIKVDFVAKTISNGTEEETIEFERDSVYKDMHSDLISGKKETVCTYNEGMSVMELIESMEKCFTTV